MPHWPMRLASRIFRWSRPTRRYTCINIVKRIPDDQTLVKHGISLALVIDKPILDC